MTDDIREIPPAAAAKPIKLRDCWVDSYPGWRKLIIGEFKLGAVRQAMDGRPHAGWLAFLYHDFEAGGRPQREMVCLNHGAPDTDELTARLRVEVEIAARFGRVEWE